MESVPPQLRKLASEEERLECLKNYELLDTEIDPELEELNHLAASICETPVSLIVLLDKDRQWFKSKYGWDKSETERCFSFCHYTILNEQDVMEVENALLDVRFCENPLVLGDPHIRFYCGAPLVNPDGFKLGSLCVIDRVPRTLNNAQKEALRVLSKQIVTHFEIHKSNLRLQNHKEELEKEVEKRTRDLLESNNELKTFIYKASHDIRGPLATIIGLSNVGSIQAKEEELQFCLSKIIETGKRLDETLKNLLRIMRLKEDDVDYENISGVEIKELIINISKAYAEEKVQFQIDVAPSIRFYTDKELFYSILKNLIDNAVKYSDWNKNKSLISIRISQEVYNELRVQIEDNGMGINESIRERVFDLFYRGNERSKGPGLGLFIAKKAVEKLNGEIYFSSTPGEQTKFNIHLPNGTQ